MADILLVLQHFLGEAFPDCPSSICPRPATRPQVTPRATLNCHQLCVCPEPPSPCKDRVAFCLSTPDPPLSVRICRTTKKPRVETPGTPGPLRGGVGRLGETKYSQFILFDFIIQVCKHGCESWGRLAHGPARQGHGELEPGGRRWGSGRAQRRQRGPGASRAGRALLLDTKGRSRPGRWAQTPEAAPTGLQALLGAVPVADRKSRVPASLAPERTCRSTWRPLRLSRHFRWDTEVPPGPPGVFGPAPANSPSVLGSRAS